MSRYEKNCLFEHVRHARRLRNCSWDACLSPATVLVVSLLPWLGTFLAGGAAGFECPVRGSKGILLNKSCLPVSLAQLQACLRFRNSAHLARVKFMLVTYRPFSRNRIRSDVIAVDRHTGRDHDRRGRCNAWTSSRDTGTHTKPNRVGHPEDRFWFFCKASGGKCCNKLSHSLSQQRTA